MELKATKVWLFNDLLVDTDISNLVQDMSLKLINEIQEKRSEIILMKFKEIFGIDLNIEDEAKRKFKRFLLNIKEMKKLFISMTEV